MNLTQMVARARSSLLASQSANFFSDDDIIDWINEEYMNCIQDIMAMKIQRFVATSNIDWVAGTNTYALPSDTLRIIRIERVLTNNVKVPLENYTRFKSAIDPGQSTDYPDYEIRDNNVIFEPTPQTTTTAACLLTYISAPSRLDLVTNTTPHASFPDIFHNILVLWAIICGKMKEGENANASAFSSRYNRAREAFLNTLSNDEGRGQVEPFNLEDDFVIDQSLWH